jgi:hypothetical protein
MRSKRMQPILFALVCLMAAGCGGQSEQPRGEQPLIQGPLRSLEVKTSETSREGGGGFTIPVHAKLYRDYLIVTYSPGTVDEQTEVIPANRIWKVVFGNAKSPAPNAAKK